jgi:hypothetical protein
VAFGNDLAPHDPVVDGVRGRGCPLAHAARFAIQVDPASDAATVRERHRRSTTLEIVPLVVIEGPEKFRDVETPHLTPDAPGPVDHAGKAAEVEEDPGRVAVRDEAGAPEQQAVRGLTAHESAVDEEERVLSAPRQGA